MIVTSVGGKGDDVAEGEANDPEDANDELLLRELLAVVVVFVIGVGAAADEDGGENIVASAAFVAVAFLTFLLLAAEVVVVVLPLVAFLLGAVDVVVGDENEVVWFCAKETCEFALSLINSN